LYFLFFYVKDIIKTVIQSSNEGETTSIIKTAQNLYKKGGFKIFTRGLLPTLVRSFPVNAATFVMYEFVQKQLEILTGVKRS
jgi:solute carrier family 25 (mitochondrial carnitine/acylcarnitine transporter), member 20/29